MKAINPLILLFIVACSTAPQKAEEGTDALAGDFQRCYIMSKSSQSGAKGYVDLQFHILTNGTIQDPQIEHSDFKEKAFHECLINVVKKSTFKPIDQETIFTQRLQFSSDQ